MYLKTFTLFATLFLSFVVRAETPVPKDHSTVHIVFVVPYEMPDMGGMGGMGGGMIQGAAVPRAIVGEMLLPIESIHPISISIDGEFVGHAMPGTSSISPVFVLPKGQHKFEFSCDGFKPTKADLKSIGTGSKQYLIVKLLRDAPNDKKAVTFDQEPKTSVPPKE